MATINIPLESSVQVGGNDGGKTPLSLQYRKALKVLLADGITNVAATLANVDQFNGGDAIYYVAQRNLTRTYTAGTVAADGVVTNTVRVPMNNRKEISYTYETLDLMQLGAKL